MSNSFDGDKLAGFIRKIEERHADLDSERGAYMARCRTIRESIGVVYAEADALGISRKFLKAHVDLRKLEGKKTAIVEKFEGDEAEEFEASADALGDFAALPLFHAARQREEAEAERPGQAEAAAAMEEAFGDGGEAEEDDPRPRFLRNGTPLN